MKEKRYHLKSALRADLIRLHQVVGELLEADSNEGFKFNDRAFGFGCLFYRFYTHYFHLVNIQSWFK